MTDKVKIHKITVMAKEFNDLNIQRIIQEIECSVDFTTVIDVETKEVDWQDGEHPLNYTDQQKDAFRELFGDTVTVSKAVYERMLMESQLMDVLSQAGVDNWEGYSYAMQLYNEQYGDDDE